jgi:CspA family cold shock protein
MQGVVKFFNSNKGFGFCSMDGGGGDVFIHNNALKRSGIESGVNQGDRLEFDVIEVDGKAPKAENIKRA